MKKYFDQLRPLERRLVLGVAVVLFIVLNWVFVWPHFKDWNEIQDRLENARTKLKSYQAAIAQKPELEKQVKAFESNGSIVLQQDQGINFLRSIQSQAAESGVAILNNSRDSIRSSDVFFVEHVLNISVSATDEQLVDFLYKLGSGDSMIRVRDLGLQPDTTHMRLNADIRLVASYQKNPAPAAGSKPAPNLSTANAK